MNYRMFAVMVLISCVSAWASEGGHHRTPSGQPSLSSPRPGTPPAGMGHRRTSSAQLRPSTPPQPSPRPGLPPLPSSQLSRLPHHNLGNEQSPINSTGYVTPGSQPTACDRAAQYTCIFCCAASVSALWIYGVSKGQLPMG